MDEPYANDPANHGHLNLDPEVIFQVGVAAVRRVPGALAGQSAIRRATAGRMREALQVGGDEAQRAPEQDALQGDEGALGEEGPLNRDGLEPERPQHPDVAPAPADGRAGPRG